MPLVSLVPIAVIAHRIITPRRNFSTVIAITLPLCMILEENGILRRMKLRGILIIFASIAFLTAPAFGQAKVDFAIYEGPEQIATGTGGTKITKNGIDYWTTGTPPRRYKIIGFVQDKRDEAWDGGNAVGSRRIAGKVKKAGGDAVIIQSQDEAGSTGSAGIGQLGGIFAGGGSKTITRMLVVKYLAD